MWDWYDIARHVRDGLAAHEAQCAREQAVYGLDARAELSLHPLIADALTVSGLGVERKVPYPGEVAARRKLNNRNRCDIVLKPSPAAKLRDPVRVLKAKDLRIGTLFEQAEETAPTAQEAATEIDPAQACWLEVKVVGQFTFTHGVPGANRTYAGELTTSCRTDLAKLAADPLIGKGALLLVMFTDEFETARHDLLIALHRALDKGVAFRSPILEHFAMLDRIGNRCCTIAITPAEQSLARE